MKPIFVGESLWCKVWMVHLCFEAIPDFFGRWVNLYWVNNEAGSSEFGRPREETVANRSSHVIGSCATSSVYKIKQKDFKIS